MIRKHKRNAAVHENGFALMMVMVLVAISLSVLAGTLQWTSSSARQAFRQTQYYSTSAAAEAATEKAVTALRQDFQNLGEAGVYENLPSYSSKVPDAYENAYWSDFEFSNGSGTVGQNYVVRTKAESYLTLNSQYEGLKGWAATYRIISNARQLNSHFKNLTASVGQDIQTASIPIFQFAIFYGLDLELHSLTSMDVWGRVHSNQIIYTYPSATTTFWADVTSVGTMINRRKQGDPAYSTAASKGSVIYKGKKETKVATLTLPIGTNNTPNAIREVILVPPAGELIQSPMGKERYYNKAELVIFVNNLTVTAFAKAPFSAVTYPILSSDISAILSTNVSFTDQREGKVIKGTQIDVAKIQAWSKTNASVGNAIGSSKAVNLIYIVDQRTLTSSQLNAVRLVNGQTLPERGLTIATPGPLYVKGHYNQPTSSHLGTTNTSTTRPASLVSDALTVLSSNWDDSKSANDYTTRNASDMTVNAAIISGIVETKTSPPTYSGGAHNLGRFLEDWSGTTFTCNGSMVVLFPSIKATAPFQQPGAYYYPPQREYSFDPNFLDATKLPPGTPSVRTIIRSEWAVLPPGKTSSTAELRDL